jgi:hypothetical protein
MKLIGGCFSALLSGLLLAGCGASKEHRETDDSTRVMKERAVALVPALIPPNHCRVIATIESIEKRLEGANDKDPCSKAPCLATLRVDSLLGYGSAFPKVLSVGQQLRVKFAFTLGPTRELIPEVKPPLPGLAEGSIVKADIKATVGMGEAEPTYMIYAYEKR